MAAANPSAKVYSKLWGILEASNAFTTLVKVGNRVKFDSAVDRGPKKPEVQSADLPEVVLVSEGFTGINLHDTSSSSKFTETFALIISTGDFRYNDIASQLNWVTICALRDWKAAFASVKWRNQPFVKKLDFFGANVGESNPERNRQIKGWVTVWRLQVEMHFATSDVVPTE